MRAEIKSVARCVVMIALSIVLAVSYTHLDVYKRQVVYSLEYARDIGCKVVNMSLGFDVYDEELARYFEELCSCLLYTSRCV